MLRSTRRNLPKNHRRYFTLPNMPAHKFREPTYWQKEAQGLATNDFNMPHRQKPGLRRFNPEYAALPRGTSSEVYKWWYWQQPFLPAQAPEGWTPPQRHGRDAWPKAWTAEFAASVLKISAPQLEVHLLRRLTEILHEETQKDGIELRRLDFEGKPLTELPDMEAIESFVMEEPTLRDKVVMEIVEREFGFTPTSAHREQIKDVQNLVKYVVGRVEVCRFPEDEEAAEAVVDVVASHPEQPELGFEHALPQDPRDPMLKEWEGMFHHPWQFGNAEYKPRSEERKRGNMEWLRLTQEWDARDAHARSVADGSAEAAHRRLVEEAAAGPQRHAEDEE